MKIKTQNFQVPAGKKLSLAKWPTETKKFYTSKEDYKSQLKDSVEAISELQNILYASGKHSVLIILQAMDAAGKDGIIRHVFTGINPQGCEVHSFKRPSEVEQRHDFLWRTTQRLPEKGKIGVFNRSYYEEVLVVRVHPEYLASQNIAPPNGKTNLWNERFISIRDFETHLARNGTLVLKFFLHVSKEEQAARLLARIEEPSKNWKFNGGDMAERGHWQDYQDAYQHCLQQTSSDHAPWYIIPADDKPNARLIVAAILADKIAHLNIAYPAATADQLREMKQFRSQLKRELQ